MLRALLMTTLIATPALAEGPKILADIPPVQALVAQVTGQAVDVLLENDADAHDFSLRPSQAQQLDAADLVVWIGPSLMPVLESHIANLAADSATLTLADLEETHRLALRDFHEDDDDHGHDHGHDDHDDEDVADPHMWLDPDNATAWLNAIAEQLAEIAPDHAQTYRANAASGAVEITAAVQDARATLAPLEGPIVVLHDAFQYFEHAFDLTVMGAIHAVDNSSPGPRDLAETLEMMDKTKPACMLTEAGASKTFVDFATQRGIPVVEIDPMGAAILASQGYPAYLKDLAGTIATGCAG